MKANEKHQTMKNERERKDDEKQTRHMLTRNNDRNRTNKEDILKTVSQIEGHSLLLLIFSINLISMSS